jgi:hypothetical protein
MGDHGHHGDFHVYSCDFSRYYLKRISMHILSAAVVASRYAHAPSTVPGAAVERAGKSAGMMTPE